MDPGQRLCLEVTYDSLYRTVRSDFWGLKKSRGGPPCATNNYNSDFFPQLVEFLVVFLKGSFFLVDFGEDDDMDMFF